MASTKTKGTGGKKRSSGSARKTAKSRPSKTETSASEPTAPAPATAASATARAQPPARPFASERMQARTSGASKTKDPLQASIERQNQLQLMIRTQNSARAWARNVRQMQVILLFVWFGFWSFLEPFLDIGHRVTHSWGLQSHRSAGHEVLILNGAIVEGLFSVIVSVGIGLAIYKGVQKAVKA